MLTIIYFLLALSLLVLVHELGHFLFAKRFNVYVHEFSLFMGPKLYSKKIGETTYSLRSIPIGGYVSMAGEQDEQAKEHFGIEVSPERTINGIHNGKKAIILVAGAAFNIIFSFLLLIAFFLGNGVVNTEPYVKVQDNSLFAQSGLQTGDKIVSMYSYLVDPGDPYGIGMEIESYDDISEIINATMPTEVGQTQVLVITYERNGEMLDAVVNRTATEVETTEVDGEIVVNKISPIFGISATTKKLGLGAAIKNSGQTLGTMSTLIFGALVKLVTTSEGIKDVSGPIGMVSAANQFAAQGFYSFLFFVALIGVNLGIFNLLPFPALDGGRLLIVGIESITKRKISPKIEGIINAIGFILIIGLLLVVTVKDIIQIK